MWKQCKYTPDQQCGENQTNPTEDISFWDVVEAVEGPGPKPIFQCKNIKDNGYLYREGCCSAPSFCTINLVMLSAEEKMRDELRTKTLSWLNDELDRVLPKQLRDDTRKYFSRSSI